MKDGVASDRFLSHGERHQKSWMCDEEKIGLGAYFRNNKIDIPDSISIK